MTSCFFAAKSAAKLIATGIQCAHSHWALSAVTVTVTGRTLHTSDSAIELELELCQVWNTLTAANCQRAVRRLRRGTLHTAHCSKLVSLLYLSFL
jgi:hypothetical protein